MALHTFTTLMCATIFSGAVSATEPNNNHLDHAITTLCPDDRVMTEKQARYCGYLKHIQDIKQAPLTHTIQKGTTHDSVSFHFGTTQLEKTVSIEKNDPDQGKIIHQYKNQIHNELQLWESHVIQNLQQHLSSSKLVL